jgi:hypothetical protein
VVDCRLSKICGVENPGAHSTFRGDGYDHIVAGMEPIPLASTYHSTIMYTFQKMGQLTAVGGYLVMACLKSRSIGRDQREGPARPYTEVSCR